MSPSPPTIVVTQIEGAEGSLAASLRARGAEVLAIPAIVITPPEDWAPLDSALAQIALFDWLVFTSRHAVDAVCGRPAWEVARREASPSLRVAAVGRATAARLGSLGVIADLVPDTAGAGSLAALLASSGARGQEDARPDARAQGGALAGLQVLWPRSDIARRDLPDALRKAGAAVAEPIAYRTRKAEGTGLEDFRARLGNGTIDAVAFMSPSSARGMCTLLGWDDLAPLAIRAVIASIGPTTTEALRELGAAPAVESAQRTADDLALTLLGYLAAFRRRAR
jgi:uroporphyrinogen-III synthase